MKRVQQESRGTSCSRNALNGGEAEPWGADPSLPSDVEPNKAFATERKDRGGGPHVDGLTETSMRRSPTVSSGGEDDLRTIDRLLEEALSSGRGCSQGLETAAEAMLAGKRPGAEHGELKHGGGASSDVTLPFRTIFPLALRSPLLQVVLVSAL